MRRLGIVLVTAAIVTALSSVALTTTGGNVAGQWCSTPEVGEEARPGVLPGPEEHRVGMAGGLIGQRRAVQAAKGHVAAAPAIVSASW